MFKKGVILAGVFSVLFLTNAYSQTTKEFTVWTFWANNYKLTGKWSLYWDIHLRSSDEVKYVRQLIIRPGITYHLSKKQSTTLGYAFIENFRRDDGIPSNDLSEHRVWEQFIQQHKVTRSFFTHRLRFEQRFLQQNIGKDVFSQRFRYNLRTVIPLKKYEEDFKKGLYVVLQDELFLNLQNKEKLNNSTFDQNRLFAGLGLRANPKLDLEFGYHNQYVKGLNANTDNNIAQFGVITKF